MEGHQVFRIDIGKEDAWTPEINHNGRRLGLFPTQEEFDHAKGQHPHERALASSLHSGQGPN